MFQKSKDTLKYHLKSGERIDTNVTPDFYHINIYREHSAQRWSNDPQIVDFSKSHSLRSPVVSSLMIRSGCSDTQIISTRANSFVFMVFGRQEHSYPTLFLTRSQRKIQKYGKSQIGGMHHPTLVRGDLATRGGFLKEISWCLQNRSPIWADGQATVRQIHDNRYEMQNFRNYHCEATNGALLWCVIGVIWTTASKSSESNTRSSNT